MKTIRLGAMLTMVALAVGCGSGDKAAGPTESESSSGSPVGTVSFDLKFRRNGAPEALACDAAGVASIRVRFLDAASADLVRSEIVRACNPSERLQVKVDAGPYNIQVQGLSREESVCYETLMSYDVPSGSGGVLTIEAQPAAEPAPGC